MRADGHHSAPGGRLGVEHVKIILQVLEVSGVGCGRRIKAYNIIVANRIGHDGKRFAIHREGKWLIAAYIIDVVDEAQVLKNAQGVWRAAARTR